MEYLPRWQILVLATIVLASSVSGFIPKPNQLQLQIGRDSSLFRSTAPIAALQDMTVKELRKLLKDSNLQERGLLSKLKRKEDLLKFLQEHLQIEGCDKGSPTTDSPTDSPTEGIPSTPTSRIRVAMPPLAPDGYSPSGFSSTQQDPLANRDRFFEQIYEMYPPLRSNNCTALGEDDVRQQYHPMLQNAAVSDMDLICVGTASCTPGASRGVSCTALRLNWRRRYHPSDGENLPEHTSFTGGTWLFDVGECTQLQIQRTNRVRPTKITKIFLTHAHGDHSFGLPGLLCLMGQDRDREAPPVDIYGPEGLRMWLRVAIRYSVSRIVPKYRVHEIIGIPMAPEWELNRRTGRYFYKVGLDQAQIKWGSKGLAGEDKDSWISRCSTIDLPPSDLFGELQGGRDIFPKYDHPLASGGAPIWEVEDEDDVKVYAAPMSHGVPCLGYVVEEQNRPGRLRNEFVEPIVKRNIQDLANAGFKIPMKVMAVIKNLPIGSAFTFPDGTVLTQEDAVEPPRKGRKVVICGDTADARALEKAAMNADVVVHEATNTFLPGIDKNSSIGMVMRDAQVHGHSTPHLAGRFARRINAKRLLLNHFSARYKGDQAVESVAIMTKFENQAKKASGLDTSDVVAAWDFLMLPIPQK